MEPLAVEAVFNIFPYLMGRLDGGAEGIDLAEAVRRLKRARRLRPMSWSAMESVFLDVLSAALSGPEKEAARAILEEIVFEPVYACTILCPDGTVHLVYQGTRNNEWLDNGTALSGLPQTNTYRAYNAQGDVLRTVVRSGDFASRQQAEALNYLERVAARHPGAKLVVSGHSKGGNKAFFAALRASRQVTVMGFDAQGFSPEALAQFRREVPDLSERMKGITRFASENDFVNPLGIPQVEEQTFFAAPQSREDVVTAHFPSSIFTPDGALREKVRQGPAGQYAARVSAWLMKRNPRLRAVIAQGDMELAQRLAGGVHGYPTGFMVLGLWFSLGPVALFLLFTAPGLRTLPLLGRTVRQHLSALGWVGALLLTAALLVPVLLLAVLSVLTGWIWQFLGTPGEIAPAKN